MEGGHLTYTGLNQRANACADAFAAGGLEPGRAAALCLPRSPELIAAILGVLKCGSAYVPVDPSYPPERRELLTAESGASHLITLNGIEALDSAAATSAEGLAYIMYTSGSTGTPKGVAIPHAGILRLVFAQDYVHFGADEVLLHHSSISFDASTFEVWGALLHGGTLVIAPDGVNQFEAIGQLIAAHGVTTAWFTGTYFNSILDEYPQALKPLRQIIAGGEALLPEAQLVNGYGPTESTTFTCCHRIPGACQQL